MQFPYESEDDALSESDDELFECEDVNSDVESDNDYNDHVEIKNSPIVRKTIINMNYINNIIIDDDELEFDL